MTRHRRLITSDRSSPVAAPRPEQRLHLPGQELPALQAWLVSHNQPRYRARQIADWAFTKRAESFEQMTNLPRALRGWLSEWVDIYRSRILAESASEDRTRKLLLGWPDGSSIETVWIPESGRNTACLSTQVGCPVGCRFCASGLDGLQRNLTAGEIVEQALRIGQLVSEHCEPGPGGSARLSNIVLMGMGEPLANYDAVLQAIRILNAPWGLGIAVRKITLSTVGLPKAIRRLAEEGLQINLAWSLHAPDDGLRRQLIPRNKAAIADLRNACAYYFERTGREVTIEYVLLDGVNTGLEQAARLARIATRLRCHVNLLRYNPVPGLPFERPSAETAYAFQRELRRQGVNAQIRSSRGQDVQAACGQLRPPTDGPPPPTQT